MRVHSFFSKFLLLLLLPLSLSALESNSPFDYDLHLTRIPGKSSQVMICFHGMGGDYRMAHLIKEMTKTDETLISFNFPDHAILRSGEYNLEKTSFGTIREILPAIYVLKKCIVDENLHTVNLYGFSAGGGAIINALAALNSTIYDQDLQKIGVTAQDKQKILTAIQKGTILLDCPLKSMEETSSARGLSPEFEVIAKRYRENKMEPIDVIKQLGNLSLHVIVYFQVPDKVLSNRNDALFISRLKQTNTRGTTEVIFGKEGTHASYHPLLWEYYFKEAKTNS